MKPGMVILQGARESDGSLLGHRHHSGSHPVQDDLLSPDQLLDAVLMLEQMFPNICRKEAVSHLRVLSSVQPFERAMQLIVDHFLQHGFPEASNNIGASSSDSAARAGKRKEVLDLSSSDSDVEDPGEDECYQEWCIFRLDVDFPRVALPSLRLAFRLFGRKLDPTYRAVNLQYTRVAVKKGLNFLDVGLTVDEGSENTGWLPRGKLKLLKYPRLPKNAPLKTCPRFQKEWTALQSEFRKSANLHVKDLLDEPRNNVGTISAVEVLVECGCCCSENPFEGLVQCADGHLFCTDCLRRHLEGYIFGGLRSFGLPTCLDTHGCDQTFPWSEVKRPYLLKFFRSMSNVRQKMRWREPNWKDCLRKGLYCLGRTGVKVYCPFCNHPWEVDRGMSVLHCLNQACRKASCIKCKESNHHPLRCEEVEKKSETSLRKKVEELMTKALIRECSSCKAELVKVDGCNKITCRRGQNMCYVCRKPINDYSHFCQHVREPAQSCRQCTGCSLWERENEAEVVKAAKVAAMQEVTAHDPSILKREIGPSDNNRHVHKKPRAVN